jgi:hypothetical protein
MHPRTPVSALSVALVLSLSWAGDSRAQEPGGDRRPEPPRQAAERILRALELPPEDLDAAAEALVAKIQFRDRLRRKAAALDATARDPWTPEEEVAQATRAYEDAADEVRRTLEEIDARLRDRVSGRAWARLLAAGWAGSGLGFPEIVSGAAREGAGAPDGGAENGPRNHRVLLATSKDGLAWILEPSSLVEKASVPELFEGPDGRAILLFVDGARGGLGALAERPDGTWERRETNLRGADPNVVPLEAGGWRAFVKASRDGRVEAWSSADGLSWEKIGEAFRDDRHPEATDPDVFRTPDGWVMLLSLGPRLLRCTSPDGLKFSSGETLDLGGSVSDTVPVEGGWRTYFHVNPDPRSGARMRIRSAFTADGRTWKAEEGDRVVAPDEGPARLGVADPAPLQRRDGGWIMAVKSFVSPPQPTGRGPRSPGGTGEPRAGAPGDRGPWNNDLLVAESDDGLHFGPGRPFVERAGVPTLVRDARGRLLAAFQWFPFDDRDAFDRVAVSTSGDDGAIWSAPRAAGFPGLPGDWSRPFDPTLALLEGGRVRMYFSALSRGERNPFTASAVSEDGVRFVFEPGVRFTVPGKPVIDCAVARLGKTWHYFAPVQDGRGKAYHAVSEDGLEFRRLDDLVLGGDLQWLGCAVAIEAGLRFYGSGMGGWSALSPDGSEWAMNSGVRTGGVDPGVASLGNGRVLMILTGPRRADAGPPPFRPEGPFRGRQGGGAGEKKAD